MNQPIFYGSCHDGGFCFAQLLRTGPTFGFLGTLTPQRQVGHPRGNPTTRLGVTGEGEGMPSEAKETMTGWAQGAQGSGDET